MSDEPLDIELRRRLGCWVDELDPRALVRKVRRARERSIIELEFDYKKQLEFVID